jgi:hypothetical protein
MVWGKTVDATVLSGLFDVKRLKRHKSHNGKSGANHLFLIVCSVFDKNAMV